MAPQDTTSNLDINHLLDIQKINLTLVNHNRKPAIYLPKACNRWGFYPVTRPFCLFKKASQLPFKMKAGETANVAAQRFITLLNTVKIRRNILLTLDCAQPIGAFEQLILSVIQAEHPGTTKEQLSRELDYLAGQALIKAERRPDGRMFCQLV